MNDQSKKKQLLIQELASLRQTVAELKQSESDCKLTEKVLAENQRQLAEANQMLQLVLDTIPVRIFWKDLDLTYLGCNRLFARDAGRQWPADIIGASDYQMGWREQADLYRKDDQEVISTGTSKINFEESQTSPEGNLIWLRTSKVPFLDLDNRIIGVLGTYDDITEHKQIEETLRESEALLQSLIDYMHDAMLILNWDGSISFANPAAARIMEFERPESFVGHNMSEYLHPDSFQKAAEDLEAVKAGKMGFPSEYQLYSVTGRHIWVESIGGKISYHNASANLVCIRDITERKLAEEKLQHTLESLRKAFGATIQVMESAMEARDPYTAGHQTRSADLARAIATEMELPQDTIDAIRIAGVIHDIGKLYIPAEILTKSATLTDIEFSMIKEHSRRGYEMLKDVESPWPLAEIIYQHHERMNGSGYPRNLKGDDILMEARIIAVADVVESISSHRPYRIALGIDTALKEIEKNRGTFYDSAVADACLRLFREKSFQLEQV